MKRGNVYALHAYPYLLKNCPPLLQLITREVDSTLQITLAHPQNQINNKEKNMSFKVKKNNFFNFIFSNLESSLISSEDGYNYHEFVPIYDTKGRLVVSPKGIHLKSKANNSQDKAFITSDVFVDISKRWIKRYYMSSEFKEKNQDRLNNFSSNHKIDIITAYLSNQEFLWSLIDLYLDWNWIISSYDENVDLAWINTKLIQLHTMVVINHVSLLKEDVSINKEIKGENSRLKLQVHNLETELNQLKIRTEALDKVNANLKYLCFIHSLSEYQQKMVKDFSIHISMGEKVIEGR